MLDLILYLSRHAEERMAQRGFRPADVAWIIGNGSEVEGGYLVRAKDVGASDQKNKQLVNVRVVCVHGTIVTAYRANRRDQRRLLQSLSWKGSEQ